MEKKKRRWFAIEDEGYFELYDPIGDIEVNDDPFGLDEVDFSDDEGVEDEY